MATRKIDPVKAEQGRQLRELRERHGYRDAKELGDDLGITKAAVSEWETGKSRPTIEHLGALNRLFDLDNEVLRIYGITVGPRGTTDSTEARAPIRREVQQAARDAIEALQRVIDPTGRARS